MTVKKINRLIFDLAVLLFIIILSCSSIFAQKKNILRVRFETATVRADVSDIVLNVYYKIEASRSAVNFHGFECRYSYDQTKLRPNTAFFDGTASANAYVKGANDLHDIGEYRVEVLASSSLDTTNPILFQVRYSIKGIKDSALIEPTKFDALSESSGIDTVIIVNSPGRDQTSWFPFGLVYIDTTHIPPPKKRDITLSSDSLDIRSDSIKGVSVSVSSLDSANLKSGMFGFDLDTSAFDSVAVLRGAMLSKTGFTVVRDSAHITVSFSGTDTLKGSGELLKIVLRGKKRTDTVCTKILNPKFTVLNADNLVASALYKLQGICVLGKKDTTVTGKVGLDKNKDLLTAVFPNPASSFIDFHVPLGQSSRKHLMVYDALGRQVFDKNFDGAGLRWEVASVSAGIYTATVTDFSALQDKTRVEKIKILIIH